MRLRYLLLVALTSLAACELFPTPTGSCQGPLAVTAPDTLVAEAFHNDCGGPEDVDGDVYQFTLISQSDLMFRMSPVGFRGSMGLYRGVYGDANPKLIFEVLGPGSAPFAARAYLPMGQYFLMAGPTGRSGGEYTVAFTPTAADNCAMFDWTDLGADINGTVTTADCSGADSKHQDTYGIWLATGQRIQVNATAGAKTFTVELRRIGEGGDALEDLVLLPTASGSISHTALSKGAYAIHVVGAPAAIGAVSYSLQVRSAP